MIQLILQLAFMLQDKTSPSKLQIFKIIFSLIMVSKGAAQAYLSDTLKRKKKKDETAKLFHELEFSEKMALVG